MHRTEVLKLLRAHSARALDPHEAAMTADTITFVETHADCFHRSQLSGHLTGSAWIVDASRTRTLLTHHRKLDKWLQLGGHADGDPDLRAVALREAREESGLTRLRLVADEPFDVDRHLIPERKGVPAHFHYDLRFVIEADPAEPLAVSDESHDLAWVELARVTSLNPEESMARMVRKTSAPEKGGEPVRDDHAVHVLSEDGRSAWRIVIGTDATEPERHAAAELRRYLAEIGRAELPIVDDSGPRQPREIWVGRSGRWSSSATTVREDPDAESFLIQSGGDHLLIAGAGRRGTLYGVYTFLEKYLDCRWFSPEVSRIPRRRQIAIGPIEDRQAPALEYREAHCFEGMDPDWAARNKCNGHITPLAPKQGGGVRYAGPFVHSFNDLVPVERHFAAHPEYFSEVNGVRLRKETQLCLSNPAVLALALNQVREWLRVEPDAAIVSVSQNDWGNPCQCPACRAVDAEEGNFSGSLIRFVNRIAEAIEPEYPRVAIDTLAYLYSRKAPRRVRPRGNVIVRLCSIECCFSHPLERCGEKMLFKTSGTESTFVEDLEAWGRICDRVYVWDYVTNFANYVLPFPNLGVLAANVRLFARNHVKGLFPLGANPPGGGGEFSALRAWLLAKLLWDPSVDEHALLREFLTGFYGRGGEPLLRYIQALIQLVESKNLHASCYDRPDSAYLTPELLAFANTCFDEAERVADDATVLARIKRERLPIRFAQLAALPLDAPEREVRLDKFAADAAAFGITQLSEHIPMERTMSYLRSGINLTHFARYEGGWSPFDNPWPVGAEPISPSGRGSS